MIGSQGGEPVLDTCTVKVSYQTLVEAVARLQAARCQLRAARLAMSGPQAQAPIYLAVCDAESKIAQAQGMLDAVAGWLAPEREGSKP